MATPLFTAVDPTETASVAGAYIPPFANNQQGSDSLPTASEIWHNPNPTTPSFLDDYQWVESYFEIHKLSFSSYRYMILFWICVAVVTLGATLLHWTGSRGGVIGASFNRFGLRRRTWRKKNAMAQAKREGKPFRQPDSFAPNAQILILSLLFIAVILMSFVGPDHVSPWTDTFDFANNWTRRALPPPPPTTSSQIPDYTISKSFWTSGARLGLTAFALFPLCVIFALKAAPFAVFSLSFLTQIHFDKLARFHIWTGRLIWFVTTIHVLLWSIQLGIDHRGAGTNKVIWAVAWWHWQFTCACIAYAALTALVILSLSSFRANNYEAFYILHIILIPITLLFSGLHFHNVAWWPWGALLLWVAERIYRAIRWAYVNGYIFAPPVSRNLRVVHDRSYSSKSGDAEFGVLDIGRESRHSLDRTGSFRTSSSRPRSHARDTWGSTRSYHSTTTTLVGRNSGSPGPESRPSHHVVSHTPPPGWAYVTLLPGKTVRLRLQTARAVNWAPGQHVILRVPCVSKYTTHPFTIASVCDSETLDGHVIELIIRARGGFTLQLWDTIVRLSSGGDYMMREKGDTRPRKGAFVKADVDGPFGSSIRARWGTYSTLVIVAGGSGISFGASLIQYACMCMSGRDGKELGGLPGGWGHGDFKTTRVRFIWLVREYSHIQWAAGIIRRCMQMVPSYTFQVDIYVSNTKSKRVSTMSYHSRAQSEMMDDEGFPLPGRHFKKLHRSESSSSIESLDSLLPPESRVGDADFGYTGRSQGFGLGHDEHELDMTNFGGEEDRKTAAEVRLNQRVKEEGKMRRAITRGKATAAAVKAKAPERRSLQAPPQGAYDPFAMPGKRLSRTLGPVTSADHYRGNSNPRSASPSGTLDDSEFNPYQTPSSAKPHGSPSGKDPLPSDGPADDILLDLDEEELEDLNVVSEMAHPGKPNLDEIIFEEVEKAQGAVGVACCGPVSLNAVVRKVVAKQISPARILAGDMRGAVNLATEEFEW